MEESKKKIKIRLMPPLVHWIPSDLDPSITLLWQPYLFHLWMLKFLHFPGSFPQVFKHDVISIIFTDILLIISFYPSLLYLQSFTSNFFHEKPLLLSSVFFLLHFSTFALSVPVDVIFTEYFKQKLHDILPLNTSSCTTWEEGPGTTVVWLPSLYPRKLKQCINII